MWSKTASNRIVIMGPFGYGNLGDAATQQAFIQHLGRLLGNFTIEAVSLNPNDTLQRHGLKTFPLGMKWMSSILPRAKQRGEGRHTSAKQTQQTGNIIASESFNVKWERIRTVLRQIGVTKLFAFLRQGISKVALAGKEVIHIYGAFLHLRRTSCLVLSGGGQLDQFWGGVWDQPYAILKWTILARLSGAKVLVLSVGVGDISSPITRWLLRRALPLAAYRSFRDEGSRQLVEKRIGIRGHNHVVPDLAYSLSIPMTLHTKGLDKWSLTVGVGPMSYCDPRDWAWPEKNETTYNGYVNKLALFVRWLIERGNRLVFYPGDGHDALVIKDIIDRAIQPGVTLRPGQIINEPIETVEGLLAALDQTDVTVASRFHGVLLPHLLNKPVLAISYERKVRTLMNDMGHQQFCLDINTFDVATLQARFVQLSAEKDSLKMQLRSKIADYQKDLDAQYERVLSFILRSEPHGVLNA